MRIFNELYIEGPARHFVKKPFLSKFEKAENIKPDPFREEVNISYQYKCSSHQLLNKMHGIFSNLPINTNLK